ncbi:MAG: AI-2E family transporter [Chloroflexota bacterium]
MKADLVKAVNQAASSLRDIAGDQLGAVTNLAVASLGIIGNLVVVVFLSVFILIDKDRILAFFIRLAPERYADEVRLLQTSVSSSFGGFLRGQAIQGVVLGLVASRRCWWLDIDYRPALAVIVGLLQMIPFFGPLRSWAPPVVVAALTGGPVVAILAIMVAGWFVVGEHHPAAGHGGLRGHPPGGGAAVGAHRPQAPGRRGRGVRASPWQPPSSPRSLLSGALACRWPTRRGQLRGAAARGTRRAAGPGAHRARRGPRRPGGHPERLQGEATGRAWRTQRRARGILTSPATRHATR